MEENNQSSNQSTPPVLSSPTSENVQLVKPPRPNSYFSTRYRKFMLLFVFLSLIPLIIVYFQVKKIYPILKDKGYNQTCTTEVKVCPDGSSVGRSGPNCEFSPCPTSNRSSTPDSIAYWKTYSSDGFSFKYPVDKFSVEERDPNYFVLKPVGETQFSGFSGLFIDVRNDRDRNKEIIESIKKDLIDPISIPLPNGEKLSGVYGPPREPGMSLEGKKLIASYIYGSNLSVYFASTDESSFQYFDQILSTFKFTN